jgi:hypothetical protein
MTFQNVLRRTVVTARNSNWQVDENEKEKKTKILFLSYSVNYAVYAQVSVYCTSFSKTDRKQTSQLKSELRKKKLRLKK